MLYDLNQASCDPFQTSVQNYLIELVRLYAELFNYFYSLGIEDKYITDLVFRRCFSLLFKL